MKTQRITKILALFMLVIAFSFAGVSNVEAHNYKKKQSNFHRCVPVQTFNSCKKKHVRHYTRRKKCVKTPLDAGALLLLTGAGAAYIGIRRKQKK